MNSKLCFSKKPLANPREPIETGTGTFRLKTTNKTTEGILISRQNAVFKTKLLQIHNKIELAQP